MDREAFRKGQFESIHKALTKQEVPLKPKHARRIILGTHHTMNCSLFWTNLDRIPLEKSAVSSWKFCHLLHNIIRDGHDNVLAESLKHTSRITKLGELHLTSSGYGEVNAQYCKLLYERLWFHKKYPQIRGDLSLAPKDVQTAVDAFTTSVDTLALMDSLLLLQTKVFNSLENSSSSSLTAQGQTLLAPLKLVVLDTSKLYDMLVKLLFHLHSVHHPELLVELRERFSVIFQQTKTFYEETGKQQYFKYLIAVPFLPAFAPNFLLATDIEQYEAPLASEIGADFDDGRSVSISDLSVYDLDEIYAVPTQRKVPLQPEQIYENMASLNISNNEKTHANLMARVEKAEQERDEAIARYTELEIKYQRALNLLMEREQGTAPTVARM